MSYSQRLSPDGTHHQRQPFIARPLRQFGMTMPGSEAVDAEWKTLYRAGGVGWIIVGILYFVEIPMFFLLVSSLSSGDAAVKNLAGQASVAQITIGLAIISHLFSVPGIPSLYQALKRVNKSIMLIAAGFLSLFVVLDMAVATPAFLSLITLSQNYAAATSDTQRTAILATANYAFSIFSTSTPAYGSLIPSLGALLASITMRRGVFKKTIATLGSVTGIIGIIAGLAFILPALTILDIANLILFGAWLILIGQKLYTLGGR